MTRIVSYSIFRDPACAMEFYADRLPVLVRAHHLIWPGWTLRVHHDDAVEKHSYWPSMKRLQDAGFLQLISCGPSVALGISSLWRMKPIFDPTCEVVACRDVDSLPMPQERAAVEEFLESGKSVHTIHGHAYHRGVMAGTSTFVAPETRLLVGFESWQEMMDAGCDVDWCAYGGDEKFLNEFILPRVSASTLVHQFGGEGLAGPAETHGHATKILNWRYADAVREAGQHSTYIGEKYDLNPAKLFYMSLDVDPVFAAIRACER